MGEKFSHDLCGGNGGPTFFSGSQLLFGTKICQSNSSMDKPVKSCDSWLPLAHVHFSFHPWRERERHQTSTRDCSYLNGAVKESVTFEVSLSFCPLLVEWKRKGKPPPRTKITTGEGQDKRGPRTGTPLWNVVNRCRLSPRNQWWSCPARMNTPMELSPEGRTPTVEKQTPNCLLRGVRKTEEYTFWTEIYEDKKTASPIQVSPLTTTPTSAVTAW